MLLLTLILIPLICAGAILFVREDRAARVAFWGAFAALVWAVVFVGRGVDFANTQTIQLGATWNWMPAMGLRFSLGVDAVAYLLILLTVFLMPLVVAGSVTAITSRRREYYFWLMVLQTAMTGVFAARDLILFYTCFEFTLIPMYFLIGVFGSANRARAAIVFFLYTFTGSIITLAALVYVAWAHWDQTGVWTFDIAALTHTASHSMTASQQAWVLLGLCCGFAVKVPLFPVHTWLPLAHTEAPTAGSVLLAAVLLKLGTYGLYRFALPMCPLAIVKYAPVIAVLCIIGILYGALVCWVQRDMKKLIAYSSVSHLGFCVLGLVSLNVIGVSGSVMYMINHGLSTGALFFMVGMLYERHHTRAIDDYSGLARLMPVWSFFMLFFIMSSVGLPGLNGFVGEFLSLLGAFVSGSGVGDPGALGPWYAAIAGVGMILAAIYLLYLAGRIVFGPIHLPTAQHDDHPAGGHEPAQRPLRRDLTGREIAVLSPLAIACLVLGLAPGLVLDPIRVPATQLTDAIRDAAPSGYRHALGPSATVTTTAVRGEENRP